VRRLNRGRAVLAGASLGLRRQLLAPAASPFLGPFLAILPGNAAEGREGSILAAIGAAPEIALYKCDGCPGSNKNLMEAKWP
jgi:hypothetical protein